MASYPRDTGFFTMKKAAQVYGVTERRVQQLVEKSFLSGVEPKAVITEVWEKRVSAQTPLLRMI